MNGINPFNEVIKNLERKELEMELIMDWYKQRNKNIAPNTPKPLNMRNN